MAAQCAVKACCGRSDLGGEQTWRPEHNEITVAPRSHFHTGVAVWIFCRCRVGPNVTKADVSWEETGICTRRTTGVWVQASGERFAEITLGRANS